MAIRSEHPRAGTATRDRRRARGPATARAGPAAERADHDGLDLRRGRGPRVRPLRQPDLDRVREGARRAGGRAVPRVRVGHGGGRPPARPRRARATRWSSPRHSYNGTLVQLADRELRGGLTATLVDLTDTAAVVAACEDAALVWFESPTNPALEVADAPAIIAAAHDAGARVVVDNTFLTPLLQRPLELGADVVAALGDEVPLRPQRRAAGRDRHPRRGTVRRAQGPPRRPGQHARAVRGLAGAAWPAHPAPARRARPGERRRARPPPRRPPAARPRSATPASARWSRSSCPAREHGRPAGARRRALGARHQPGGRRVDRSSAAAGGSPSPRPSPRGWSGCRSASRTWRTYGPTSAARWTALGPS